MAKNFISRLKSLLSGLALTILGSFLWEVVLKPIYPAASYGFINIFTFSLTAIQDSIFQDISLGNYDRGSAFLLNAIASMIICFYAYVVYNSIFLDKIAKSRLNLENINLEELNLRKKKLLFIFRGVAFFMFFPLATLFFMIFINVYEIKTEAHLRRLIQFDETFIDHQMILKLRSEFSSMRNKSDYDALLQKLVRIGVDNDVSSHKALTTP